MLLRFMRPCSDRRQGETRAPKVHATAFRSSMYINIYFFYPHNPFVELCVDSVMLRHTLVCMYVWETLASPSLTWSAARGFQSLHCVVSVVETTQQHLPKSHPCV